MANVGHLMKMGLHTFVALLFIVLANIPSLPLFSVTEVNVDNHLNVTEFSFFDRHEVVHSKDTGAQADPTYCLDGENAVDCNIFDSGNAMLSTSMIFNGIAILLHIVTLGVDASVLPNTMKKARWVLGVLLVRVLCVVITVGLVTAWVENSHASGNLHKKTEAHLETNSHEALGIGAAFYWFAMAINIAQLVTYLGDHGSKTMRGRKGSAEEKESFTQVAAV